MSAFESRVYRCLERSGISLVEVQKYSNGDCTGQYYEKVIDRAGIQIETRSESFKVKTMVSCEAPRLQGRYYTTSGFIDHSTHGPTNAPASPGYNEYPYQHTVPFNGQSDYNSYGYATPSASSSLQPTCNAGGFLYQTYVREGVCNWEKDVVTKATCPADAHSVNVGFFALDYYNSAAFSDLFAW